MKKSLLLCVCLAGMTLSFIGCKSMESLTSSIPFINKADDKKDDKKTDTASLIQYSKNKDGEIAKAVREERKKAKELAASKRNIGVETEEKELTPPELLDKANEEFGQKEFYQAEQDYQKYLTLVRPQGDSKLLALPYHRLGLIAQKRRQMDKAQEFLTLAIQNDPDKNPQITLDYAKVLYDLEEYERSEKLLSFLNDQYPEMKEARYYLGQARLKANPSEDLIPLLAEDYGEEEACRMIASRCREIGNNELADRLENQIKETQFQNDQIFLVRKGQENLSQKTQQEPQADEKNLALNHQEVSKTESEDLMANEVNETTEQVALGDLPTLEGSFLDAESAPSESDEVPLPAVMEDETSAIVQQSTEIQESEDPLPSLLPHPNFDETFAKESSEELETPALPNPESLPDLTNSTDGRKESPLDESYDDESYIEDKTDEFPSVEANLSDSFPSEETENNSDLAALPDSSENGFPTLDSEEDEELAHLLDSAENSENIEDSKEMEDLEGLENLERLKPSQEKAFDSAAQDFAETESSDSLEISLSQDHLNLAKKNSAKEKKGLRINNSVPVETLTQITLNPPRPGLNMGMQEENLAANSSEDFQDREDIQEMTDSQGGHFEVIEETIKNENAVENNGVENFEESEDSEDFAWATSSESSNEEFLEEEVFPSVSEDVYPSSSSATIKTNLDKTPSETRDSSSENASASPSVLPSPILPSPALPTSVKPKKSKKTSEEKLIEAQKAGAKITVLTPEEYKKELATRAKIMVDNAKSEVKNNSKLTEKQKKSFLKELEPSF